MNNVLHSTRFSFNIFLYGMLNNYKCLYIIILKLRLFCLYINIIFDKAITALSELYSQCLNMVWLQTLYKSRSSFRKSVIQNNFYRNVPTISQLVCDVSDTLVGVEMFLIEQKNPTCFYCPTIGLCLSQCGASGHPINCRKIVISHHMAQLFKIFKGF